MEKSLTALCVLYLLSSAQGGGQPLGIDLVTGVFNDRYIGCHSQMEQRMPATLKTEINKDETFGNLWSQSEDIWEKSLTWNGRNLPSEFRREHGAALLFLTMKASLPHIQHFRGELVKVNRSSSYYHSGFGYKALHYYLTRAVQLLQGLCSSHITTANPSATTALRFGSTYPAIITACGAISPRNVQLYQPEVEVRIAASRMVRLPGQNTKYWLITTAQPHSNYNCLSPQKSGRKANAAPVTGAATDDYLSSGDEPDFYEDVTGAQGEIYPSSEDKYNLSTQAGEGEDTKWIIICAVIGAAVIVIAAIVTIRICGKRSKRDKRRAKPVPTEDC